MSRINASIRQKILARLMEKEKTGGLIKAKNDSIDAGADQPHPAKTDSSANNFLAELTKTSKQEMLKIGLITAIAIFLILGSLWADIQTQFLSRWAQDLAEFLHI